MTPIVDAFQSLDPRTLIPEDWVANAGGSDGSYVFNPTICRRPGGGYALAYRVVMRGSERRMIATCQLDAGLALVPGSVTPLSDLITFAAREDHGLRALTWHADPRYFTLGDEIYLTWNDGSATPQNHQFILRMDADGSRPGGEAREIIARRARRAVEKNWIFFEAEGQAWCIYSTFPHDVMHVDLGDPKLVTCTPTHVATSEESDYEVIFGTVRGGTQPIDLGDRLLMIAHSSFKMLDDLRYYACVAYEISARAPFEVLRSSPAPFTLPADDSASSFQLAKLNGEVGGVVYPCGAVLDGEDVVVSYGVNDEAAYLTRIPLADLEAQLEPVAATGSVELLGSAVSPEATAPVDTLRPDLFWWDSRDQLFDKSYGTRRFRTGNFGDIASRDVVERVVGSATRPSSADSPRLLAIGSIAHVARNGDVLWGCGFKGTRRALDLDVTDVDVRAVRGPLSAEILRSQGIDMGRLTHVFDPGCLVARLYAREIAAYDVAQNDHRGRIRIVPHYRDDIFYRRKYPQHMRSFLSVDETPQGMIEKMLGAEAVFSSSLHGIVFAEALGIPAYFITPFGGEDVFKYYDYYYGTGRYAVRSFDTLEEAMARPALPLPEFDVDAYLATFPHDRMADLSRYGIASDTDAAMGTLTPEESATIVDYDPGTWIPTVRGLSAPAAKAALRLPIARKDWSGGVVSLSIGRDGEDADRPLEASLRIAGKPFARLNWQAGATQPHAITFHAPATMEGRQIDVEVVADKTGPQDRIVLESVVSTPLEGSAGIGFLNAEDREAIRAETIRTVRSVYSANDVEYLLDVSALPRAMTANERELEGRYIRLVHGAEFLVPSEVLADTKTIFMAGPSMSAPDALSRLKLIVDGRECPVKGAEDSAMGAWRFNCPVPLSTTGGDSLSRVAIRFDDTPEAWKMGRFARRQSILVRKIALRKRS
jgi:predicted GH43/DUF377 family glycosyl hydrolase